jgi:hypothetical protein
LGPSNWVPTLTGRRARRNSGGAPGRGRVRGQPHAHLGSVGGRGLGGDVASMGARRWPAAAAAAGRAPAREGSTGGNACLGKMLRVLGDATHARGGPETKQGGGLPAAATATRESGGSGVERREEAERALK